MTRVFIAGGTGYIGSATVAAAKAAGLTPVVLTRSEANAAALSRSGVDVVRGDLATFDASSLECNSAIFVAAPPTWGKRVSLAVARDFERGLAAMTRSFFKALEGKRVDKIVYIAGTSYFGDAGDGAARNELEAAEGKAKGWGPFLVPAIDVVMAEQKQGTPVVLALPGQVYGPASWTEQLLLRPIESGKAVTGLKGYDPFFSAVHVDDCGRAIVHLLAHGKAGERYIVVDDEPMRFSLFAAEVARLLGKPLRTRRVPRWLCRLIIGPVLTEYATAHTNFSNAKLRATGFALRYPRARDGLPDVISRWRGRGTR